MLSQVDPFLASQSQPMRKRWFHGPTDGSDEAQSVWWSQIGGSCLANWWLKEGNNT